jgi:spermidine synthase
MVSAVSLAFLLGFSSAVSQFLVFRELMTALYGNELVFAGLMSCWFIAVAVGCGAYTFLEKKFPARPYVTEGLLAAGGSFLPLTVIMTRGLRTVMGWPPGQVLDIFSVLGISFLVIFPLALVWGALFKAIMTYACRQGQKEGLAGKVYGVEAVGFAAGGVAAVIALNRTGTLDIAWLVFFLHLIFLALMARSFGRSWLILTAAVFFFVTGCNQKIESLSRAWQWQGFEVVDSRDSVYGNLTVLERRGERSLFENGLLSGTTHDALTSEESVQYALLAHLDPGRVLVVGGGPAGMVREVLKHPGTTLDYVERDPLIIRLLLDFFPGISRDLGNSRVHYVFEDGRRFIRLKEASYDVMIVAIPDPQTLLSNRYYTKEFFAQAARALLPGGILSLRVSGSENYVNQEGRAFLSSVYRTLKSVFAEVRVLPGSSYIFLATDTKGGIAFTPDALASRLRDRGVDTQYVRDYYFNDRFSARRLEAGQDVVSGNGLDNTDERPAAFLLSLGYSSTRFGPVFSRIIRFFEHSSFVLFLIPLALAAGMLAAGARVVPRSGIVVLAAGFTQMAFQTATVLLFQSFYGYVYSALGVLTGLFMLGIFFGCRLPRQAGGQGAEAFFERTRMLAFMTALGISGSAAVLLKGGPAGAGMFFILVPFATGWISGRQFAAAALLSGDRSSGLLYGLDVLGAAVGVFLSGIFLIPCWGAERVFLFCTLLNLLLWLGGRFQPAR